jgi:hypothetical protein
VLTQLSDVQWEANGLFGMDRRPHADLEEIRLVNQPAAVVLRASPSAAASGDKVHVVVDVVPDQRYEAPVLEVELLLGATVVLWTEVPSHGRSTWTAEVELPDGPVVVDLVARLWGPGRCSPGTGPRSASWRRSRDASTPS